GQTPFSSVLVVSAWSLPAGRVTGNSANYKMVLAPAALVPVNGVPCEANRRDGRAPREQAHRALQLDTDLPTLRVRLCAMMAHRLTGSKSLISSALLPFSRAESAVAGFQPQVLLRYWFA